MMDKDRAHPSDQALAVPAAPANAVDGPSGFDPSRDKTALSYWFPKVAAAGLPVPKTFIVPMPNGVRKTIFTHLWGEEADATNVESFVAELRGIAAPLGTPFFLRTDHTSGKHGWNSTCFVADAAQLSRHVYAIAEDSEMAGIIGLPWNMWVLREMLPTIPMGVCPAYSGMPVCKEFRFFVDGPKVECFHPYWPRHALEQGGCELSDAEYAALCDPGDTAALGSLASRAGEAVGGRWSVDLLETERGWFLTDMAEAHKSFHWEGCTASAGEARSDETQSGSARQGEHAVAEGQTPKGQSESQQGTEEG